MYYREKANCILEEIFFDRFNLSLKNNNRIMKETSLLGKAWGLNARDLIYIFFDIEKRFGIEIPQEKVAEGLFDSYNHILDIVCEQLKESESFV